VVVVAAACASGAGGGRGCVGVGATRGRFDRRAEGGGSDVASAGLLSGCVFRFFREAGAGVCTVDGGPTAAAGVELEEAAWLAA